MRPSLAIARHELRVMRTDLETPMFLILMPVLMMAFLKPVFELTLQAEGFAGANGSEQAVPGMAVMFSGFFVGYVGFAFMRDHGWGTWERLRASPASPLEIMAGKIVPPLLISAMQLIVLFGLGGLLFDLSINGSIVALLFVITALVLSFMAFGIAVTALSRTSQQLNALGSAGGMIFATFGGALAPVSVMPGWAAAVAPATPTYWAMRGFRSVILEGGGVASVLLPTIVLLLFGAAFTAIAVVKFNFEETKVYFG
ncbi:MAG: ABC transporter permease [Actinomycetota bacterium]